MRAGTLRYILLFRQVIKTQSASGASKTSKVDLLTCRAAKIKAKNGYGEDAKEMFHSSILEFKIRFNKLITTELTVMYRGSEYRILSVDENKSDNSLNVVIDKVNA